jgi:hypothetical protein
LKPKWLVGRLVKANVNEVGISVSNTLIPYLHLHVEWSVERRELTDLFRTSELLKRGNYSQRGASARLTSQPRAGVLLVEIMLCNSQACPKTI